MLTHKILDWLLSGDVSIQYQVQRDLLLAGDEKVSALQKQIEKEGWGARFLRKQKKNGHWGIGFYQPKWTSTHYTLLDIKTICVPPDNMQARRSVSMVLGAPLGEYGGINLAGSLVTSDVCINGMILSYASYFYPEHRALRIVVDYLMDTHMADGGWNCQYLRPGTSHSSLHSPSACWKAYWNFERQANIVFRKSKMPSKMPSDSC